MSICWNIFHPLTLQSVAATLTLRYVQKQTRLLGSQNSLQKCMLLKTTCGPVRKALVGPLERQGREVPGWEPHTWHFPIGTPAIHYHQHHPTPPLLSSPLLSSQSRAQPCSSSSTTTTTTSKSPQRPSKARASHPQHLVCNPQLQSQLQAGCGHDGGGDGSRELHIAGLCLACCRAAHQQDVALPR
jgi:hypothetical protein